MFVTLCFYVFSSVIVSCQSIIVSLDHDISSGDCVTMSCHPSYHCVTNSQCHTTCSSHCVNVSCYHIMSPCQLKQWLCHCVMCHQVGSVRRAVFIVYFQGDQLKEKVKKICDGW